MSHKRFLILFIFLIFIQACQTSSSGSGGVPLPPDEDFGVLCFVEFEDTIVANAPNFHVFYSQDGGLTWQEEGFDYSRLSGSDCSPNKVLPTELWATPNGSVRYRFNPGHSIEISLDNGKTWEVEYDLSPIRWEPINTPEPSYEIIAQAGPLDAIIDSNSGNLLLAMGHAGILLGQPSGEWRWVSVGPYTNDELVTIATPRDEDDTKPPSSTLITPDLEMDTENNYVNALAFAPDGTRLAASGFDGGIKLFNFPQGDLVTWQQWGQDARYSKLYGAIFSPDGGTLITCGTNVDQTLRFWDVESWELINQYEGYQTSVLDVGTYVDEQFFAIGLGSQVKIFRLPEGEEFAFFDSQLSGIASLRFIPETSLIAVGGVDGGVELWNFDQGEIIFTLQPDYNADGRRSLYTKVDSMGYDPTEGVLMALFGDGRLSAWCVTTGEPIWYLALNVPHGWYMNTSAFSPDAIKVAVGMYNGTLILFDSKSGKTLTRQWISDGGTLMRLAFSPDSQWFAAGFTTGQVKIWQVNNFSQ